MENVNNLPWEYHVLLGDIFIRCKGRNKFEYLTGTEDSLQWKTLTDIASIAREIPKNSMRLENERDARDLYLRCEAKRREES